MTNSECWLGNAANAPAQGVLPGAIAKFKTVDNIVAIGVKQSPVGTYLWGIPVGDLIGWEPPKNLGTHQGGPAAQPLQAAATPISRRWLLVEDV